MEAVIIVVVIIIIINLIFSNRTQRSNSIYQSPPTKKTSNFVISELSDTKPHRVNHCWKCKTKVDNHKHEECSRCGWIKCTGCGACNVNCRGGAVKAKKKPIEEMKTRSATEKAQAIEDSMPRVRVEKPMLYYNGSYYYPDIDTFLLSVFPKIKNRELLSKYELNILRFLRTYTKLNALGYDQYTDLLRDGLVEDTITDDMLQLITYEADKRGESVLRRVHPDGMCSQYDGDEFLDNYHGDFYDNDYSGSEPLDGADYWVDIPYEHDD